MVLIFPVNFFIDSVATVCLQRSWLAMEKRLARIYLAFLRLRTIRLFLVGCEKLDESGSKIEGNEILQENTKSASSIPRRFAPFSLRFKIRVQIQKTIHWTDGNKTGRGKFFIE
jgi:hypothetical protein